jgi:hypothetical protein
LKLRVWQLIFWNLRFWVRILKKNCATESSGAQYKLSSLAKQFRLTSYFKFILQKYQVVLDFWPLFAYMACFAVVLACVYPWT